MNDFIPVNEPLLKGNEKKYLNECIDTGWISAEGPFVKEFEKKFTERINRKHGIAVCNGTTALRVALAALDLKQGDEVILPAFTIISCALAIVEQGAVPVVVDSDPITWNMDVNQIEKNITDKTKAIMVVHIYGLPVDMDPVLEIAKKYNLKVIEDAAEMIGQMYKNKPCGSFGDISTFSFFSNKHITTGEGGMVVTNDDNLADRSRSLRNLCFSAGNNRFIHNELGWNFRMTNIQAALGVAQLERLDEFIKIKRNIGKIYTEQLSEINKFQLPLTKTDYADNIYWVYGIVLKDNVTINASKMMQMLADEQIGTRPFFYPINKQPVFIKMGMFKNVECPVAQNLAERGFYIPGGLAITERQMKRVIDVLKQISNKI